MPIDPFTLSAIIGGGSALLKWKQAQDQNFEADRHNKQARKARAMSGFNPSLYTKDMGYVDPFTSAIEGGIQGGLSGYATGASAEALSEAGASNAATKALMAQQLMSSGQGGDNKNMWLALALLGKQKEPGSIYAPQSRSYLTDKPLNLAEELRNDELRGYR
jgi:hypothetical protein